MTQFSSAWCLFYLYLSIKGVADESGSVRLPETQRPPPAHSRQGVASRPQPRVRRADDFPVPSSPSLPSQRWRVALHLSQRRSPLVDPPPRTAARLGCDILLACLDQNRRPYRARAALLQSIYEPCVQEFLPVASFCRRRYRLQSASGSRSSSPTQIKIIKKRVENVRMCIGQGRCHRASPTAHQCDQHAFAFPMTWLLTRLFK